MEYRKLRLPISGTEDFLRKFKKHFGEVRISSLLNKYSREEISNYFKQFVYVLNEYKISCYKLKINLSDKDQVLIDEEDISVIFLQSIDTLMDSKTLSVEQLARTAAKIVDNSEITYKSNLSGVSRLDLYYNGIYFDSIGKFSEYLGLQKSTVARLLKRYDFNTELVVEKILEQKNKTTKDNKVEHSNKKESKKYVFYKGDSPMTVTQAIKYYKVKNLHRNLVASRISSGKFSPFEAITFPRFDKGPKPKLINFHGKQLTIAEISKKLKISKQSISKRLNEGKSIEDIEKELFAIRHSSSQVHKINNDDLYF